MGEGDSASTAILKQPRRGYNFGHYFQMRALKQLTQWAIIGAVSIFFLGIFATADAFAQSSGQIDIAGISTTIDGKSVDLDAGAMDFNAPDFDGINAHLYSPGGDQNLELRGWVWDTNLGWISLYCGDGINLAKSCGSQDYGVIVDLNTGQLSGWAWGDNIGWISFQCNSKLENEKLKCGEPKFSITYDSYLNLSVNNNLGQFSGYAWADSVGWFNLEGVNTLVLGLIVQASDNETDWGIWTKSEITDFPAATPSKLPITNPTMPVANGSDGYDLIVHVADIGGNPIDGGTPGITVDIVTTWVDTVSKDQTVAGSGTYNTKNTGAASKPGIGTNNLIYTPGDPTVLGRTDNYRGIVTSVAPTDGGNCLDGDGDGFCGGDDDWYYREFGENIDPQTLTYLGAEVTITKIGPPFETITVTAPIISGQEMDYLPIIDIPTLNFILPSGDPVNIIQATRNKADVFEIEGSTLVPYAKTFYVGLELIQDDPAIFWQFIETLSTLSVEGTGLNPLGKNELPFGDYYAIPYAPGTELQDQIGGAMIRSTIDLIDDGVKYYNNGLPRTSDSVILNQVAQILSGSVFSPGATDVSSVSDVALFGDAAVYKLRTQILADVSALARGVDISDGANAGFIINGSTSSVLLENHSLKNDRVYYFDNHDVYLEDITALTDRQDTRPISIIVRGGDIYVRNNIEADVAIGLIAMESRTDSAEATKGGHLYIHADVTDLVDVSIFSDGPMFRYTDSSCFYSGADNSGFDSLRTPNFAIDGAPWPCYEEPVSSLPNQFYLKGNVASLNCLGCSSSADPVRGDNKSLNGATAENYAVSRLYDLNYFSNYREDVTTPAGGDYTGGHSNNVPAGDHYPVYFEYAAAPTDLFGFRIF